MPPLVSSRHRRTPQLSPKPICPETWPSLRSAQKCGGVDLLAPEAMRVKVRHPPEEGSAVANLVAELRALDSLFSMTDA